MSGEGGGEEEEEDEDDQQELFRVMLILGAKLTLSFCYIFIPYKTCFIMFVRILHFF